MDCDLHTAVPLLSRTPEVLDVLLRDLPSAWVSRTEGPDTWSPYDVVGHLIHGERTDWMPRAEHLLAHGEAMPFPTFDRFAQFEASKGKSLPELLDTFRELRADSLRRLAALRLTTADLDRTGQHPEFGRVTLGQHLATWVAHDLDHLVQIARVMGRQYTEAVGPWRQYLRIIGPA
ncbi:MAG: DinB family protein [Acidobacteria bacterium]|nr:DinB family protein [Acidobacteriota bacterium]